MKKYLVKAEKQTTYRIETIERIVTCDNIEEAIKVKFRGLDAFLKSFFRTPNARILSIKKI